MSQSVVLKSALIGDLDVSDFRHSTLVGFVNGSYLSRMQALRKVKDFASAGGKQMVFTPIVLPVYFVLLKLYVFIYNYLKSHGK